MKKLLIFSLACLIQFSVSAQVDTMIIPEKDTSLRIRNLSPMFTVHVDSTLKYQFEINKKNEDYYWFLDNSPVGLQINKDNGLLTFKAHKGYFLSGRLKYDHEYKVTMRVQNLDDPRDRIDTSFKLLFFNTEIVPSRIKPTVTQNLYIEEGDSIRFKLQCDDGSFPIENITYISNHPVKSETEVTKCGDEFSWYAPFDFIKENESQQSKTLELYFIGFNKFHQSDTARIAIVVKSSINYPLQVKEFQELRSDIAKYILQLKSSFREVDRKIKKTRKTRTAFDLASASTALSGTVFSSLPSESQQTTGKILPSVGVALVPVKEATVPNSSFDQNTASLIRSSIKRLEYLLSDNDLISDRDPNILKKSTRLKDEMKQVQIQLIDIPIGEEVTDSTELDEYFNSPKVNKKYRLRRNSKGN